MFGIPALNTRELEVRASIQELNDELRHQLRLGNRWTGALRRTTFARNIQGSNSIEGIHASVDDIDAIASGEKPAEVDAETARALSGYQLAMTFVLQLAKSDFEIDNSLLRSLHFMVSSYDMTRWPGRFRKGPVYVVQEQTQDIVHEGALAEEVPVLIADLGDSLTQIQNANGEDLLLAAAMAHLNFVLIHPFKDGNGRMARILQSLVLAAGDEYSPVFMTIEEYLGRHTQSYYDVLAEVGQGNWNTATYDPELTRPWIRFILTAHWNQALELKQRNAAAAEAAAKMEDLLAESSLNERSIEALYSAMFGGTVTRARYMSALADAGEPISEQTASRDLGALVDAGLLLAHGDKRGRRYTPGGKVRQASRSAGLGYAWRQVDPFKE